MQSDRLLFDYQLNPGTDKNQLSSVAVHSGIDGEQALWYFSMLNQKQGQLWFLNDN